MLALDFYSLVKMINYIRTEVASGNTKPNCSDSAAWQDDKFLKPVLEDDGLLSCLYDAEDLLATEEDEGAEKGEAVDEGGQAEEGAAKATS
jgi:type I protein arginine methyltransferase